MGVDLGRFGSESIARPLVLQACGIGPQCLAQSRHVDMEHVSCGVGRLACPQVIQQPVGRDRGRSDEQPCQERTLTRWTEIDRLVVLEDLELTKDPEIGGHDRPHPSRRLGRTIHLHARVRRVGIEFDSGRRSGCPDAAGSRAATALEPQRAAVEPGSPLCSATGRNDSTKRRDTYAYST